MVCPVFTDLFSLTCPLSGRAVATEAAGRGGRAAVSKSPAHAEYHHQEEPEERVSFFSVNTLSHLKHFDVE